MGMALQARTEEEREALVGKCETSSPRPTAAACSLPHVRRPRAPRRVERARQCYGLLSAGNGGISASVRSTSFKTPMTW